MAKGSKVALGIKDEPETLKEITGLHKSPAGYYQGLKEPFKKDAAQDDDPPSKPARVVSRHDHPVTVTYFGDAVVLAPRGDVVVNNSDKLGALPRGVFLVPAPELAKAPAPR